MAYLTIRIKNQDGYTQEDLTEERTVVGRSEDCGVCIKHESVSRQHCAFVRVGDEWLVEDLGSANGTRVGDDKIAGRKTLGSRDIVKIGKCRLTFHAGERSEQGKKKPASEGIELDKDVLAGKAVSKTREIGVDDAAEATTCDHCGAWVSIAHRVAGETMTCPACGRTFAVPQLVG